MRFACITVFLCLTITPSAGAQLQPGDIVIIGLRSDGTDRFAWVPLVDLEEEQVIYFTDAGWNAEQGMFQRQINEAANPATTSPSGGAMRYTVPSGGLEAGTVVHVRIDSRTTGEPGAYVLTVTGADAADFSAANDEDIFGDQGVSISTSGDQLIIFTGSPEDPFFLFGVNTGASVWDRGSTSAQHASDVPEGLTDTVTAIAIGAGPDSGDEVDNGRYTGPVEGTDAFLLAAVTDRSNWETSDSPIDDLTNGVSMFSIIPDSIPLPVPDTTSFIALETVFVEPGEETKLAFSITNTSNIDIGEIRFRIYLGGMSHFSIEDVIVDELLDGFEVETAWSVQGDTLEILAFSATGATIPTGTFTLGSLCITADDGPVPDILASETAVELIEESLSVTNAFGQKVGSAGTNGLIRIGIRGDVNRDGRTDIVDVIKCVRLILQLDGNVQPEPNTVSFTIADGNADGLINISDAIAIVNRILGIHPVMPKPVPDKPAVVRLGTPVFLEDGQYSVPVFIASQRPIAGVQMTFSYQPSRMTTGTPISHPSSNLVMDSAATEGKRTVILYSLAPTPILLSSSIPFLEIPIVLSQHSNNAEFILTDVILADRAARRMPVRIESGTRIIQADDEATPDAFALLGNTPNPFNPTTAIAYIVPEPAHITLTVYNILGQEVVRLVNQRQSAGRYRVVWDGKSAAGKDAASGLYLYRLSSDTGYRATRRMTLVK